MVVRDGERVRLEIVPELATVGDEEVGRVGIVLGVERIGIVPSLVAGVKEVGFAIEESVSQVGHVFGPQGIGRLFTLLTTDADRTTTDATSVVGISEQVGATSSTGDWGTILYFFAFITVFIGLINLVPLPPFDGGHLAVVGYEKVTHHTVDMRKLIPVSAVVITFFVIFVSATVVPGLRQADPDPVATFSQVTGLVATISQHRLGLGDTCGGYDSRHERTDDPGGGRRGGHRRGGSGAARERGVPGRRRVRRAAGDPAPRRAPSPIWSCWT